MTERSATADIRLATLAKDPIENADKHDPTLPIDSTDPTEPIDSTDPREPMHKIESLDLIDHNEPSWETIGNHPSHYCLATIIII